MKLAKVFFLVFLLFLVEPLITQPATHAQDPPSDTLWILGEKDTATVGTAFKMSVDLSNTHAAVWRIIMNFAFEDTDLVRLDSFSFFDTTCRLYDPTVLDARVFDTEKPDTVRLDFSRHQGSVLPDSSGKIVDLWFFGIREGLFFVDTIDSVEVYPQGSASSVDAAFFTDSVVLSTHSDPGSPDSLWTKRDLDGVIDTIGINAKFPLPFTAFTDEILSGFEIPLTISGSNVPTLHRLTFEDSDLRDTILVPDDSTLVEDSTVLIRLELKKELTDTLLAPGDTNRLFNLWLQADEEAGSCSIYSAFVPHVSNLFFFDDAGGFTPYSSGITCNTFSYRQGDITGNDVVNNVDLFYLAVHLFLPPDDTSAGKLRYDPEDLERIESQRAFQRAEIPSEQWDSTFSQILFRGDVNGDSRVDVGDFYVMSRHFQAGTSDDLEYGWSDPQVLGPCTDDTVRLNFRKAYPAQTIQILVEIYNKDSLAAVTIPLQIPLITQLECDSVTLAGRFARLEYFDWEWITWDEDYDDDSTTQEMLIVLSTLGIPGFPHIPESDTSYADSAFILWCTVKDSLLDKSYLKVASLSPSHEISFFEVAKGYSCRPHLDNYMAPTPLADYGDAPDCTNPCYAGCSFPTLCNTNCCRICGRQGPYHQYDPVCTGWFGTSGNPPTQEWTAMIPNMDQDDLTDALYIQADKRAWYIAPVTVTSDSDVYRYLNVLYDIDRDREWKTNEHTEWVVRNKLIIPSGLGTQDIIIGPIELDQLPSASDTAWARFTLTRDSIPTALFDSVGGWDGSGPDGGWHYGETEDIPFDKWKGLINEICFSVNSDSLCEVPSQGTKVDVIAELVGYPPGDIIKGLSLNWQLFDSTGIGSTVTCTFDASDPGGWDPDSFDLGRPPTGDSVVTFTYDVSFPGDPNERTCRAQWKVGKALEDGRKLVATAETRFEESAEPYFVFLNSSGEPISWDDTTISYYGGVVDLRLLVHDPDEDYPLRVYFERGAFEGAGVENAAVFGILGDSTKVLHRKADSIDQVDSLYAYTPNDTLVIFHWAADPADTGSRMFKFRATDSTQASVESTLIIQVSDNDSLLPPDKVWVGRTGVVERQNVRLRVPVEVYNTDTLQMIVFPFEVLGHIDSLLDWSWDDPAYCLVDESILEKRATSPSLPTEQPITVVCSLRQVAGTKPLEPGYCKLFDLVFKGDTTTFQIGAFEQIEFTSTDDTETYPDLESYEIRVMKEEVDWICGDANGDGEVGLADVVYEINYIFRGGPEPIPLEAGDVNCDGIDNSADVVYKINHLFRGGPPLCDPNDDGVPDC